MKVSSPAWLRRLVSEWVPSHGSGLRCSLMLLGATGYLCLVWSFSIVTELHIPMLALLLVVVANVYALSWVGRVSILASSDNGDCRHAWETKIFLCLFAVYTLVSMLASYSTPDTAWQWAQAIGERPFDDWHPVAHTGLLAAVRFFVREQSLVLLVQNACLVLLLRCLHTALCAAGVNRIFSLIAIVIVGYSPFTFHLVAALQKDTAFGICVVGITVMLVKIIEDRDGWLNVQRAVLLAVLIAYAAFVRHNGIFYAIPLVVLLPLGVSSRNRRNAIVAASLAVALMVGYIAVRNQLKRCGIIEECRSGQNFEESVGLPMSILAECYVRHEEQMPIEACRFLEFIHDRDIWHAEFDGTYNSVKFHSVSNSLSRFVSATTPKRFAGIFVDTVRANPISAVKSFLFVTQQAWSPCPDHLDYAVGIGGGLFGYNVSALSSIVQRSPIGNIVTAPGFFMMCLVVAFFWRARTDFKRALLYFVPVASYHFGTMFFLTGWDWRFFFPTVLVAYPLTLVLIKPPISQFFSAGKTQVRV